MLQNDQLLPWKTIYENAVLGLRIQKIKDPAAYKRVERLLASYGLEDFRDSYPDQLSGGMRQRAARSAPWPSLLIFFCWMNPSPRWIIRPG